MKRVFTTYLALFLCLISFAQESNLMQRIREVNLPASLQAGWTQVKHSSLLSENLQSSGMLYLQSPDKLRWETLSPITSVSVLNGAQGRGRFRLPSEQDFKATILENGAEYTINLEPLRRDLKALFSRIVVTVDRSTLRIRSALLVNPDGDWSQIRFTDVIPNVELPETLFEKP